MIQVGDRLPDLKLSEYSEIEAAGCSLGPNPVDLSAACAGKRIVIFGLPGAFTPTCSAQHVPGYVSNHDALRSAGIDEVWCISVNDAFVMGAWAREQHCAGKVRMIADGDAAFAKATGLTLDLHGRGMGLRSCRYSMVVDDGIVTRLNVEQPGKFEVSGADRMLEQLAG